MKKMLITAGLAASVLLLGACSSNQALVEFPHDKITKEDFYQELKTAQGMNVMAGMIELKVLENKYNVTEEEIKEEKEKLKGQFPSDEEFKNYMSQYGLTTDEDINEYIKSQRLYYKVISDGVDLSDENLKKYYEENKEKYHTLEASHILVDKEEDAKHLLQQVKDGADFATLAKENSKDTTASNGGSLGEFGKGQMVEEFEKAAFELEEGEVSDLVKSVYGYHIIKVDKINKKTFEDAKESVKNDYLTENGNTYEEVMAKSLKQAKVTVNDEEYKDVLQVMIDQYNSTVQQMKDAEKSDDTSEVTPEDSGETTGESAQSKN